MSDGDWRNGGFLQRRPSAETLAWVAASMGRGSRVVGRRRVTLHPWWDLYALLHHDDDQPKRIREQVAGRRPVDFRNATYRVELVIEAALRRLG